MVSFDCFHVAQFHLNFQCHLASSPCLPHDPAVLPILLPEMGYANIAALRQGRFPLHESLFDYVPQTAEGQASLLKGEG